MVGSKYLYSLALLLAFGFFFLLQPTEGRRGKGRGRTRQNTMQMLIVDPSAKAEYYNNPLGARITKASHFDYEYVLGHKIVFICESKGTPRPSVTWFKDGVEVYAHPYMQIQEWHFDVDRIKSKIEIDPATQMDAGMYECQANNKYSVDRRIFKADFSISE